MFKIKGPSLRDLVEKFIRLAVDVSYETLVLGAGAAWPMERILKSNRAFKNTPTPDMRRTSLSNTLTGLREITKNQRINSQESIGFTGIRRNFQFYQ